MPSTRFLLCGLAFLCATTYVVCEDNQIYPPPDGGAPPSDNEDDDLANAPWDEETTGDETPTEQKVNPVHMQQGGGEAHQQTEEEKKEEAARLAKLTPLERMMEKGEWGGIEKLAKESPADAIVPNQWQESALHMSSAPHNPQPAALKALIAAAKSHGNGINEQDVDGCTPLIWAVHNNHYENAKILIDAGADFNIKDKKDRVAKDHAMSSKMKSLFLAPGEVADSGVPDVEPADFKKEVMDHDTDVVLYMYSPSCGHCREFAPIYDELAAGLRPTSLKFLKMDVTKGEGPPKDYQVGQLPTLFFSKLNERAKPYAYDGPRSTQAITKWFQTKSTNRIMFLTGGGKEADVPETFNQAEQAPEQPELMQQETPDESDEL